MPFSLQDSDIFTDLKKLMNCNYISDIRIGKNRRKANKILKTLNLENYTFYSFRICIIIYIIKKLRSQIILRQKNF